jgi:hypothetical protein
VHQSVTAGDAEALALLDDEVFDPRAAAVLPLGAAVPALGGGSGAADGVQVAEAWPGRLALDVAAGSSGLLVVSQPYYPGWQARVDGERRAVQQVDYLLQGVALEAGSHRVELDFRPSPLPALASVAVLLGCLAAAFVHRRSGRQEIRSSDT